MYYWLKEPGCYGVYVISDDSDRIYHVQDGEPTQMKPPMQCFLKFKPYMEFIKKTLNDMYRHSCRIDKIEPNETVLKALNFEGDVI